MTKKQSMNKFRKKINRTIAKLSLMTEQEAEDYLEGEDLIFAQYCFKQVFGRYIIIL